MSLFRVTAVALCFAIALPTLDAFAGEYASPRDRREAMEKERAARGLPRPLRQGQKRNSRWWLFDDSAVYADPAAKGKKAKKPQSQIPEIDYADYSDPEPIPGLGFGNIPYVLPKLLAVRDAALPAAATASTESASIRVVLSDAETPIKASPEIRDAVLAHYKASDFRPVWTANGTLTERGATLLRLLSLSFQEGLEPNRYLPRVLASFDNADKQIEGSAIAAAQLDVGLTVAALTYALHLSGGAYDPGKLSLYYDVKPEAVEPAKALRVLAYSPYPQVYLQSLAPKHPAYAAMKAELANLRVAAVTETETPFPEGKRIKTGQKDARIPELRGRMIRLGHLDDAEPLAEDADPEVLDKRLAKALKSFQTAEGIPQTSALDPATVKALNGGSSIANIDKLRINMERLRWLPKVLGEKHVFVNQASYEVEVRDKGERIWQSKVIVGRPTTQTNVFSDVMENIVFNPSWGMPQSILINEYLGKLRRDPGYFDRIGYKVTNASGKVVSSRSIRWGSVGANSGIGVQQPPGAGNALGELKFNFPNTHAIYMHDTPNRNLFEESRRNFSHGCVRVQNPRDFAAVLLGLSREEIDARVETGASETVHLSQHIPVHLSYFTAWPGDDGTMRYFADPYQRDESLFRALGIDSKAFAPDQSLRIVEASAAPTQNNVVE